MMKLFSGWSTERDSRKAALEAWSRAEIPKETVPSFLMVFGTEQYPMEEMSKTFIEVAGRPFPVLGGTSCQGVMTEKGFHSEDGRGVGILVISDPGGRYGVAGSVLGDVPRKIASKVLEEALNDAGSPGEVPELVWLISAPGKEEEILAGIIDVLGPHVPIAGGSSADNEIAGTWSQVAHQKKFVDGLVIGVFFPTSAIATSFHSGYDPTTYRGIITRAEGRVLHEIDGRPAARVYNEWTGGSLSPFLERGGNVLSHTTLLPLGREEGKVQKIPVFKLSHPASIRPDGVMTLFSNVKTGEEIVLMKGSMESLVSRAGRVMKSAIVSEELSLDRLCGAFVIYCAGCMLTVKEHMGRVVQSLNHESGNKPFLGAFTLGEQGCLGGKTNTHGNLMITVVAFGEKE